ncbi:hypothetical protein T484DRAFT_1868357 [Baffinella frigidus]|nr:hypothetical protein T484DRAFT_1868357 [Cryptophyta sp. CCMP2293]
MEEEGGNSEPPQFHNWISSWDKTVRVWKVEEDGGNSDALLVLKEHTSSILSLQVREHSTGEG